MPSKEKDRNLLCLAFNRAEFSRSEVKVSLDLEPRAFSHGNLTVLGFMTKARCEIDRVSHYSELTAVATSHWCGHHQSGIDADVYVRRLDLAAKAGGKFLHGQLHV